MQVSPRRTVATLLAAVVAATVALALPAVPASATTPPFEPGDSVGTISFYNSSGNVITSGSTNTAPFAAYAVGSAPIRAGDTQAGLFFANPDPNSLPALWYKEQVGLFTPYPLSSGPSTVKTLSQSHPVATGGTSDQTLDGFRSDLLNPSTQAGYDHVVQVRMRTADAGGQQTATYDDADVLVNDTTHTWTQIYPGDITTTTTTLTAAPSPAAAGAPVTLTATETPKTAGSVLFKDGSHNLGSAVDVDSNGVATKSVSTLSVGTHHLSATFTPTSSSFTSSTGTTTEVVTSTAQASAMSISAPKSVTYGSHFHVSGTLTDAKTSKGVSGEPVSLFERPKAGKPYKLVKKVTTDAKGGASVSIKATANGQYQWRYAGNDQHKQVTSATKSVQVSQVVLIAHDPSSVKHGKSVNIYGTVQPASSGQVVHLQRSVAGKWKTLTNKATIHRQKLPKLGRTVGYLLVVKLATKGSYKFRVQKPKTATLAVGYSPATTVRAT